MGYSHFRYARRVDGDVIQLVHNDGTQLLKLDKGTANKIFLTGGGGTTGDWLSLYANTTDSKPMINIKGNDGITLGIATGSEVKVDGASTAHFFNDVGVHFMLETSTPTAKTNYGAIYCKNDDKLYFQDGAGAEHEVSLV